MTQKTRQILFYVFVLLFLILTPTISFYASGYKLGSGLNLEKTGILIVDTEPASAAIYINGEIQQDFVSKLMKADKGYLTTPQKIKNLIPGEYNIKMEKDGYWPWEKRLIIKPGESTFAEDVVLFKKNLPTLSESGNSQNGLVLNNQNKFYYLSNEKLANIDGDNVSLRNLQEEFSGDAELSPHKNKIISGRFIYNLYDENSPFLSLDKIIGAKTKQVRWGENDNEIFYTNNGSLYLYNLNDNQTSAINSSKNIRNYLVKNSYIYNITNSSNTTELEVIDRGKNEIVKKISLPTADYEFRNEANYLINLYDTNHEILYLIDPLSPFKPLRETINGLKYSFWLNKDILIFANDFELWAYNARTAQKNIFIRISQPIKSIIAHPDENYILFSTGNDINILELDDRDHYNITKILEIEKLDNLTINQDGDKVYFNGKIGGQEGLFRLEI